MTSKIQWLGEKKVGVGDLPTCLANCESQYGMSAGANLDFGKLAQCTSDCVTASQIPPGGQVPGGGQAPIPVPVPGQDPPPPPPPPNQEPPPSPPKQEPICPAGQVLVNGQCVPNASSITKPAEESKSLPWGWIIGGVAVVGGLAWLALRGSGAAAGGVASNPSELTEAQRRAVLAYAAEHGRNWKSDLRADWMRASARVGGEHSAELQQVRNTLGPSWLNRVSLRDLQRSASNPNDLQFKRGDKLNIRAHRSEPGKGLTYPAMVVTASEDGRGGQHGGWDVYDGVTDFDEPVSFYGFSVESKVVRRPRRDNPSEPRPKFKIYLERVKLDRGGYDSRGRYWGVGAPLYRYSDDSGAIDGYVRASSRADAKERVRYQSPGMDVSFYRA